MRRIEYERIENRGLIGMAHMVESDHDVALEDTDRIHGRTALVNNVKAASSLAGAIRSTLGPKGLDKMLVDGDGSALVTNDGVTVLEKANVEHPTARLLIDASSSQDRAARDGTTTTVLLVAEMLQNALELVRMGVHPSIIVNGYSIALEESIKETEKVSRVSDDEQKSQVVRTSLQGKGDSSMCGLIASLAVEAADGLVDLEGGDDLERMVVKRLQIREGSVMDSSLVAGLMVLKSRVDSTSPENSDGGVVAIIDGGLEHAKLETEASIEVSSLGIMQEFHERSRENMQKQVAHLSSLGVDLLVVREGISDEAITQLTKEGIVAYRRFDRSDMDLLSRITGARPARSVSSLGDDDLGAYSKRSEERVADVKHTLIEGDGGGMTLVVRGSSPAVREEAIRIFDDAIGVAHRLNSRPGVLPGGGAIQSHLARHLRSFSQTQSGREQLAIEAYASALESIPRILAENAGRDPVEVILSLSADQRESGAWIGFDLQSGKNCDMGEMGVLDTEFVVKHALSGATEAAIGVLRIDDVLWARTDPSTPDWEGEEEI
jgi:chaperonin GroEL (HSP60 family)